MSHEAPSLIISPPRSPLFTVVRVILLVVAGVIILGDLVLAVTVATGHALVTFGGASGALPLSHLPLLSEAVRAKGGHGTLASAAVSLRIAGALPSLIHAATVFVAVALLLRVLRRVREARPFHPATIRDWRLLSGVLIVGGVVQGVVATCGWVYLSSRIGLLFGAGRVTDEQRARFLGGTYRELATGMPHWPVSIFLAGLIALTLTAAFRQGARLEEEAEGVV